MDIDLAGNFNNIDNTKCIMRIEDNKMDNKNNVVLAENQLPFDSAWLFPEYDFEAISLRDHRGVIIERILERGSWEQIRWLFNTFGEELVAKWVKEHGFRLLSKRSFALWRLTLGITDYKAPQWAAKAKETEAW